jgi:hypothetical protein
MSMPDYFQQEEDDDFVGRPFFGGDNVSVAPNDDAGPFNQRQGVNSLNGVQEGTQWTYGSGGFNVPHVPQATQGNVPSHVSVASTPSVVANSGYFGSI